MHITINAGHAPEGNPDPGAVNKDTGLQEAIVNYKVSMKLLAILKNDGHIVQVVQDDSLQAICDTSNDFNSDIFVSIHCNSFIDPVAHGTETYCYEGSTKGSLLAQYIHSELVAIGLTNRGTKTAGFYVLKHTDAPAVLVELAFISNPEEEKMLADDNAQHTFSEAIFRGIQHYFKEVL